MSRFNYTPWYDESGNLLGTTIEETGGYFAGIDPDTLKRYAEDHYPHMRGQLTETFANAYFNHTLRDAMRLRGIRETEELPAGEGTVQEQDTTTGQ